MAIFRILVAEIMAMPSARCSGMRPDDPLLTVGEVVDCFEDYEYQDEIADQISADGQQTPVAIVNGELADGHHRVIAAAKLGLTFVLATDGKDGEWGLPAGILAAETILLSFQFEVYWR